MKRIFDNKIFKFVFKTIEVLIFTVIIVYLAFMLIQRFSGDKSVFGYRVYTVATGSMEGVYNINDVIAVKDCDTNKLKVGDDIAYRGTRGGLEGLLVTHRIIKIEDAEGGGKLFFTQGVKSNIADPAITASQIVGKVEGVVPVITPLNHIVRSQVGFFFCIFCPMVLVIVLEVLQTITDIKIENHELEEVKKVSEKSDSEKGESKDDSEKGKSKDASEKEGAKDASEKGKSKDDSEKEKSKDDSEKGKSKDASEKGKSKDDSEKEKSKGASEKEINQKEKAILENVSTEDDIEII